MSAHSGKFGVVNGADTIRNWALEQTSASQPFVASNTRGGTGRRRGVKDWTGNYGSYGSLPPVMPGDEFAFEGYTAPDDDAWGSDGLTYYGQALATQLALTLNFEAAEIWNYTTTFGGHGALARKSDIVTDDTDPAAPTPLDSRLLILDPDRSILGSDTGSASGGAEFCASSCDVTLTVPDNPYANSCTDGWMERKAGPLDFTGSILVHDIDPDSFGLEIGDDVILQMWVDATDYWEFTWVHIKDFTGLTVDRETGAIMSMTIAFEMNGFVDGLGDGQILLPGTPETPWWPVAAS